VIQWSFLLGLSRPQSVAAVLDAAGVDTIEQFKDVKINGPGDPVLNDKFDLIKTVYAQCPDGSKVHTAKSSPDDLRRFVRLQQGGEVHAEVRTVNKQVSRPGATIQRRKGSEASEIALQDAQPMPEPVANAPADEQPVQPPGLTFNSAPWRVRGLMLVLKIVSPWGFVGDQSELRNSRTGEIVPLTKRNVRALLNDPDRSDLPDDWPEADMSIDAHPADDPGGAPASHIPGRENVTSCTQDANPLRNSPVLAGIEFRNKVDDRPQAVRYADFNRLIREWNDFVAERSQHA
jgi:hypothetical protein